MNKYQIKENLMSLVNIFTLRRRFIRKERRNRKRRMRNHPKKRSKKFKSPCMAVGQPPVAEQIKKL